MNVWKITALCAMGLGMVPVAMLAAPRGRSTATDWQLDLAFHDPQRISVQLPGDREQSVYWYLLYTVTNHTGQDRGFFPSFRLVTDTLQVIEGGADINPRIEDRIVARHKGQYPFMLPPAKAPGMLLQGEANQRTSFVVFRDFDKKASSFGVYAGGLSGVIDLRPNPAFDSSKPESQTNARQFLLRRTLELQFDFPGDSVTRARSVPVRQNRRWVMR